MKPSAMVFQETLGEEVVREARYDQITHFTSGDKYTTAHYGDGLELVLRIPLKALAAAHPDLVYVHRSALVKFDQILSTRREVGPGHVYIAELRNSQRLTVSRSCYRVIRDRLIARRKREAMMKAREEKSMNKKPERKPVFYNQGKRARTMHEAKDTNPYARNSPAAAWWLTGWDDTDIEAENLCQN